jgi:hypothetical protein
MESLDGDALMATDLETRVRFPPPPPFIFLYSYARPLLSCNGRIHGGWVYFYSEELDTRPLLSCNGRIHGGWVYFFLENYICNELPIS